MASAPSSYPNLDAMWGLFRGDRFAASIGAVLEEWSPGHARLAWTPGADDVNFAGAVHGGAIFTLADAAFAVACNSWGRMAVALTVDVHFLSAVAPGERLVATGTERTRTHRTGSYHLDVHAIGDDDRHVASLHAMAHRTSRWHLGEDAWPDEWRSFA